MLRSLLKEETQNKDIRQIITLDTSVINFGTFAPGKLLGSTICVKNKSDVDQEVELLMEHESECYSVPELTKEPRYNLFKDIVQQGDLSKIGKSLRNYSKD